MSRRNERLPVTSARGLGCVKTHTSAKCRKCHSPKGVIGQRTKHKSSPARNSFGKFFCGRKGHSRFYRARVIRDRAGRAASPTTSVIAPKAEVHSGRSRRCGGPLRVDGVGRDVIQVPNWSLESCATNSAIMNGLRSSRCCPTSRMAFGV
jgi:hypothetical protein